MTTPAELPPSAPPPPEPATLGALAGRHRVLLCDVWGVIHNGRVRFPEACEALVRWRAEAGPVILISNSPRPNAAVAPQLEALGVPRGAWDAFVTSGDATRALLAARAPGPAWAIGPERDAPLYAGLGLDFAGPAEAAFIACTGPVDDETEGPEHYRAPLEVAAARGLTMICANPDRVVHRGDRLIYCGGALADLYEALGGAVIMAGKPWSPIYDLALAEAARRLGAPLAPADALAPGDVLAIGDGVATDVLGANRRDLPCLFIAGGIHGGELVDAAGHADPAAAAALLARDGAHAAYVAPTLRW